MSIIDSRLLVVAITGMVGYVNAAPLQICVDKVPNPPFVYSEKIQGAGKLRGYSLDVVKKALSQIAVPYAIKTLSAAEINKKIQSPLPNAGCDIVLDVERGSLSDSTVLLTQSIYRLHFDLVYNWEVYMTGLDAKNLADVNKFKVCGVKGVNYGAVAKNLKIHELNSIKDVMFNIKSKECDVFVAEGVLMRYGQRANQYQVPPVGCVRLAGTEKSYHFAIAKHVPNAVEIHAKLQQALNMMNSDLIVLADEYDVNPIRCQQSFNVN